MDPPVQRFVVTLGRGSRDREKREQGKAHPSLGLVHDKQGRQLSHNRFRTLLLRFHTACPDGGIGRHDRLKLC